MVKNNDKFIREIAEEFDIPLFVARQICDSPYKFLKKTMATKNMDGVMFPYLGKFLVNPNRRKFIIEYRDAQNKAKRDLSGSLQQGDVQEGGDSPR